MLIDKEHIASVLPQRPPMIMVDSLLHWTEASTRTAFTVEQGNVFLEDTVLQESGLLENIAQTAAAGVGYAAQQAAQPVPVGFIAMVKNFEVYALPVLGDTIETLVTVSNQVMNVTIVQGEQWLNDALISKCEMRIFIDDSH